MAALFDKLKALAGFGGRRNDARSAGRNKRREISGKDESEGVERRRLVFVRVLDLPLAGLVYMIVVMRVKVRMDE